MRLRKPVTTCFIRKVEGESPVMNKGVGTWVSWFSLKMHKG